MNLPAEDVTLLLAIEDFLPIIFSAIGLFYLARLAGRADPRFGELARTGMIVITAGGLAKAVWKVVASTTGEDVVVLERTLFGLMAPGFVFVALALLAATNVARARRAAVVTSRTAVALLALAIGFGIGQSGVRGLELFLLLVTVIASTAVYVRGIQVARARDVQGAAALFGFTLVAAYVLGGVGAMDQTVALQWTEQLVNTVAQLAFARGAWLLSQRYVPSGPPPVAPPPALAADDQ